MPRAADPQERSTTVKKHVMKKVSGGTIPIEFKPENYKHNYVDEYTGKVLPHNLLREAMEDELMDFNEKVWEWATLDR